jgi:hypothetical protein
LGEECVTMKRLFSYLAIQPSSHPAIQLTSPLALPTQYSSFPAHIPDRPCHDRNASLDLFRSVVAV